MLYGAGRQKDVAHAFQTRNLVDQVDLGVVAQVELVVAAVRRNQVDHQHQVGRALVHRHADLLDDVGRIGMASATRFCTSTCAMFRSVPTLKVTVNW